MRGLLAGLLVGSVAASASAQPAPPLSSGAWAWGDTDGPRGPDGVMELTVDENGVAVELTLGAPAFTPTEEDIEVMRQPDGSVVLTSSSDPALRIVVRPTAEGPVAEGLPRRARPVPLRPWDAIHASMWFELRDLAHNCQAGCPTRREERFLLLVARAARAGVVAAGVAPTTLSLAQAERVLTEASRAAAREPGVTPRCGACRREAARATAAARAYVTELAAGAATPPP